jgi:hypothetical protein
MIEAPIAGERDPDVLAGLGTAGVAPVAATS